MATAPGEAIAPDRKAHYRPHLDGLRTVAVTLVVAFHAGLGRFRGGFVGVDVFFVLSGFLVTGILLRDLGAGGRIRGRAFYARRIRRILPAAFVALVVTAFAYAIVATPAEMLDALGGFRAAFFYVANWFFIRQATNYFAANVNGNPVVHFWSLAVEEQFYLLWPLLLTGLYAVTARAGRRRWWLLRGIVLVAAAVSVIEALHIGSTNIDRAYYGTDTRAYQLLAGAALAMTPQLLRLGAAGRRAARVVTPLAIVGLLLLGSSVFDISPITRGVFVAGVTVLLLVALENTAGGITKNVLSSRPFTYLGEISYGIYLWHWPVIIVAGHGRHLTPVEMFALSLPIATALAALSFHLVEHPIRVSHVLDRIQVPVIAIGLATSLVAGALVMPAILDRGSSAIAGGGGTGLRLLDWRAAKNDYAPTQTCLGEPVDRCTIVNGSGTSVLLVGDSHARMWDPTFIALANRLGWKLSLAVLPDCPWQEGMFYALQLEQCRRHQADWYARVIPQLHPDIVFLGEQATDDPRFFPVGTQMPENYTDRKTFDKAVIDVSRHALQRLSSPGRKLVILEPTPLSPRGDNDPINCLSTGASPSRCVYTANPTATALERFYRSAANDKTVWSLDLDRFVCPRLPTCDAIVHDIIVKRDWSHITATYAQSLAGPMLALLRKDHIV